MIFHSGFRVLLLSRLLQELPNQPLPSCASSLLLAVTMASPEIIKVTAFPIENHLLMKSKKVFKHNPNKHYYLKAVYCFSSS